MDKLKEFLSVHEPVFRKNLDEIELIRKYNIHKNTIDDIMKRMDSSKKLVLFGANQSGILALQLLDEQNIRAHMFCDNFSNDKAFGCGDYSLPVVRPNALLEIKDDIEIIIASGRYIEILKQLEGIGLAEKVVGIVNLGGFFSPSAASVKAQKDAIEANVEEIIKTYTMLADSKSKEVFINILNFKLKYDYSYVLNIADDKSTQYFDRDIVKLNDEEVFVDCGAYNGDTLKSFIDFTDCRGGWTLQKNCLF